MLHMNEHIAQYTDCTIYSCKLQLEHKVFQNVCYLYDLHKCCSSISSVALPKPSRYHGVSINLRVKLQIMILYSPCLDVRPINCSSLLL